MPFLIELGAGVQRNVTMTFLMVNISLRSKRRREGEREGEGWKKNGRGTLGRREGKGAPFSSLLPSLPFSFFSHPDRTEKRDRICTYALNIL